MNKLVTSQLQQQEKVNVYFQSQSSYWKEIYASDGVQGQVIRDRHTAALDWIESLGLAPGSQVLEIGCGAGFMALTLAQRGLRVHAIDSSEAMVELARRHAAESGIGDLLTLDVGDVYALSFEDDCFDLVIAIGVIAWLKQPELAMQEMARVTKPDGHVILTAANRAGLHSLLDPWLNPALSPLKRGMKDILERAGLLHWSPSMTSHDRRFIDKAVERAELVKIGGRTVGFGPFSLFRHTVLPEPFGTTLHQRLQRLADRGMPVLRSTGMSYLVLAKKPASRPPGQSTSVEEAISVVTEAL